MMHPRVALAALAAVAHSVASAADLLGVVSATSVTAGFHSLDASIRAESLRLSEPV